MRGCVYPSSRRTYADQFLEAAQKMDDCDYGAFTEEAPEYKLEHSEIYQKYLNIFEKKIQGMQRESAGEGWHHYEYQLYMFISTTHPCLTLLCHPSTYTLLDYIEENDATIEEFYRQCQSILDVEGDWDPRR